MISVSVWLLIFSAFQGHSDSLTTMSPFIYPSQKDCQKVADRGGAGAYCVNTSILVSANSISGK